MTKKRKLKRHISTHKLVTNIVHIVCGLFAIYIFYQWGQGNVSDAPEMLRPIEWIEITNLSQYAAKSGYDHKNKIFDGVVENTMNDMNEPIAVVASKILQPDPLGDDNH